MRLYEPAMRRVQVKGNLYTFSEISKQIEHCEDL
jgi:hypothetical protein